MEIEKDWERERESVCLWSYVNARASEKLSAGVLVGMGNPNKTESEATWAAKEGEIKTVGEGGGGLRFLERAISGSVALLTAIEASVFLHSLWKWECKVLLGWWYSRSRSRSRSTKLSLSLRDQHGFSILIWESGKVITWNEDWKQKAVDTTVFL